MPPTLTSWRNRSPGDLLIELDEVARTPIEPAVNAATDAFAGWSRRPMAERIDILRQAREAIVAAKDELARGIALETGKPIREAIGEISAVIAKFDLTFEDAQRYLADRPVPENPHPAVIRRRPRGPAAVIGPFNFPIHLAHGALLAHLVAGNTVIFKPSPLAAVVAGKYAGLMSKALPQGVFNLVQGFGEEGQGLCQHPTVRSICFTGSAAVGKILARELAGDLGKDLALELGGKNASIVCADADLEKAADAVAESVCLTAGQRCNATSRVIVEQRVANEFIKLLIPAVSRYQPGDPMDEKTLLGPLVSNTALERFRKLTATPADWILPGTIPAAVNGKKGHYVTPAIVRFPEAGSAPAELSREEAFAPLLSVFVAKDIPDAVAIHNQTPYGLSASIFTTRRQIFHEIGSQLAVGNLYANLPTTFSPSTLPFGGIGESGNRHPGGRGFARFVADEQAVQEAKEGFSIVT